MSHSVGLESLTQRGKSAFYKDLVSLYQETFTVLKSDPGSSSDHIQMVLRQMGFSEKLKKIVVGNSNLPIARVYVRANSDPNMAVLRKYAKPDLKRNRLEINQGVIIEKINALYDDRAGSITEPIVTKDSPVQFSLIMTTGNWKGDRQTPEALASITLHELGHVDYFIRSYGRAYKRLIDSSGIVDYILVQPDLQVISALITALKKSPFLDKEWKKTLLVVEEYFKTSNSSDDPMYMEALTALSTLVASESAQITLQTSNQLFDHGEQRRSTSAVRRDDERSADEFAVRHGGAAGSIKFLKGSMDHAHGEKLDEFYKLVTGENATLLVHLQSFFYTVFKMPALDLANGYDPLNRRMHLMIETAKHAFSDADLPADIADDIRKDTAEAEHYFAEYEKSGVAKMRDAIRRWKAAVGTFGRLVQSPFHNRLTQDYTRLQEANRSLTRHPLYYLSQK